MEIIQAQEPVPAHRPDTTDFTHKLETFDDTFETLIDYFAIIGFDKS